MDLVERREGDPARFLTARCAHDARLGEALPNRNVGAPDAEPRSSTDLRPT
ncbi:hypothetical protein [Streptomyces sp. NBC_00996]|uniref:hypothetical protein n=1 Tax=Streptomyces sp. NBC_00996 TaxID=2903710 RepID=UPI00386C14E8|nr:hypothetical protein OG390_40975 [Streptomyces sp. NBC_00996]